MKRGESSKHPGSRVIWDEENLLLWETNRTPKLKINEPKTPYHPPEEENTVSPTPEQNAAHADSIRLALSQVASSSVRRGGEHADDDGNGASSSNLCVPPGSSSDCPDPKGMDTDEPPNKLWRRKSFEEKRRRHQLEYRKAKSVLHSQAMIDDDEIDYRDKGQASGSGGSGSTSGPDDLESNITKGLGDIDIQDA